MRVHAARVQVGLVAVLLTLAMPTAASRAQISPAVERIANGGFGDRQNSYAWSAAWFKGKFYVGTARNMLCVENATLDHYYPGLNFYSTQPVREVSCPANKHDLDLRAEIWRFTPETKSWARVFRSPADIRNPRAPGKYVARDIGFRGMTVYREPDGTEALYIGGVTAIEYIPELKESNPPRILRTTDGTSFAPIMGAPGVMATAYGPHRPIGYRAMAVYKGRLYVTASAGLLGDGVVFEVQKPSTTQPTTFVQVSPETLQVFEMEVFNGYLYLGVGDTKNSRGYSVWRTDADGPPFKLTPIVIEGAGRYSTVTSVVSMHVYRDRLYVGSSGWYSTPFPVSELIRINPDDSWELVVGNPRTTQDLSIKYPISGQPDGFGNGFNAHFWRMQEHHAGLHLGTNDWSWAFRDIPGADNALRPGYGFDLYRTGDGQYWSAMTTNAFNDGLYNFGARTMVSSPSGHYIGSTNHAEGAAVWRDTAISSVATSSNTTGQVTPPTRLLTDVQLCGTVLSWDAVAGASSYRLFRAELQIHELSVEPPPTISGGYLEGSTPKPAALGSLTSKRGTIATAGPFTAIGSTTRPSFVDKTARLDVRYLYQVRAESSRQTSAPSNRALVPSERPKVTFEELSGVITTFAGRGKFTDGGEAKLLKLVTEAQTKWSSGDRQGALDALGRLEDAIRQSLESGGVVRDPIAREDLLDLVFRLQRLITYANTACF